MKNSAADAVNGRYMSVSSLICIYSWHGNTDGGAGGGDLILHVS